MSCLKECGLLVFGCLATTWFFSDIADTVYTGEAGLIADVPIT